MTSRNDLNKVLSHTRRCFVVLWTTTISHPRCPKARANCRRRCGLGSCSQIASYERQLKARDLVLLLHSVVHASTVSARSQTKDSPDWTGQEEFIKDKRSYEMKAVSPALAGI